MSGFKPKTEMISSNDLIRKGFMESCDGLLTGYSKADGYAQCATATVNEKREVDYEKVEALAYQLVNTGSDAVLVTGTTGEAPTLTYEEEGPHLIVPGKKEIKTEEPHLIL